MKKHGRGAYLIDGRKLVFSEDAERSDELRRFSEREIADAPTGTISYDILKKHNVSGNMKKLQIKFDALVGQDMTYMGVLQTAIASGVKEFPLPFVLSNCHNSLCTLGGTANEDDHVYAQCAARKYGAIMLPIHQSVMHQYMREQFAGGGKMILGADSHTRYGALGTLATGEGGGELVKQLLGKTYDVDYPQTVLIYMTGALRPGVGPHDVMLDIIRNVFADGFVKNKIMEFVGPGIASMSVDCRNGVDVMATESSGMFTIWETDEAVREWLGVHGREADYRELHPGRLAYYDSVLEVDLSEIRPMIALPFHPSNAYAIEELNENLEDILYRTECACNEQMAEFGVKLDLRSKIRGGRLHVDQGIIAGCAGGLFENICNAADILRTGHIGNGGYHLQIYPASQPVLYEVIRQGIASTILESGANLRTAFCGPCFGAGDVPFNGALSIRHTTRNFSNREGSNPSERQLSAVALMDAKSIAATSVNGGFLTPATDLDLSYTKYDYRFRSELYEKRVLNYYRKAEPDTEIIKGPSIGDIPEIPPLRENILVKLTAFITDPVTTTDELIPNGQSSSFRSNFERIADFTLSAKVPEYVSRCKRVRRWQKTLTAGGDPFEDAELAAVRRVLEEKGWRPTADEICVGSGLYATRPGDGSAREYAASNQKVLGGWLNICRQFATKRYRSNLINWGVLPFTYPGELCFGVDSYLWIPAIRSQLLEGKSLIAAYVLEEGGELRKIELSLDKLDERERRIIAEGCLINYYRNHADEQ